MNKKKSLIGVVAPIFISFLIFSVFFELGSRYYYRYYYIKSSDSSANQFILTIGDSFCASSKSFPYVLGEKVQGTYKVLNASEGGAGPDNYLMNMALNLGRKPQICIVSFYLGNDITDLRDHQTDPWRNRVKLFLGRNLYSYQVIRMVWVRIKYHVSDSERKSALEHGIRNPHMFAAGKAQPDIVMRNLKVSGADVLDAWDTLGILVKDMMELAQQHNVPLFAVLIPDCVQVSNDYQNVYRKAGFKIDSATTDLTKPQQLLIDILNQNQIPYLDLLPKFKQLNVPGIYYSDDPHMTTMGHKITANLLIDKLLELKLIVPKEAPSGISPTKESISSEQAN